MAEPHCRKERGCSNHCHREVLIWYHIRHTIHIECIHTTSHCYHPGNSHPTLYKYTCTAERESTLQTSHESHHSVWADLHIHMCLPIQYLPTEEHTDTRCVHVDLHVQYIVCDIMGLGDENE